MASVVFNDHVVANSHHLRTIHELESPNKCHLAGLVLSFFERLLILFFHNETYFPAFAALAFSSASAWAARILLNLITTATKKNPTKNAMTVFPTMNTCMVLSSYFPAFAALNLGASNSSKGSGR